MVYNKKFPQPDLAKFLQGRYLFFLLGLTSRELFDLGGELLLTSPGQVQLIEHIRIPLRPTARAEDREGKTDYL